MNFLDTLDRCVTGAATRLLNEYVLVPTSVLPADLEKLSASNSDYWNLIKYKRLKNGNKLEGTNAIGEANGD